MVHEIYFINPRQQLKFKVLCETEFCPRALEHISHPKDLLFTLLKSYNAHDVHNIQPL